MYALFLIPAIPGLFGAFMYYVAKKSNPGHGSGGFGSGLMMIFAAFIMIISAITELIMILSYFVLGKYGILIGMLIPILFLISSWYFLKHKESKKNTEQQDHGR
jgi:ABC-type antimicrobial peptide transport system permease subunit